MMQQLPAMWWHVVLDGEAYSVNVDDTPYPNLTALRSAAYREAEIRGCIAATHKTGIKTMIIMAWGGEGHPVQAFPRLKGATTQPAPVLQQTPTPKPKPRVCDCGQGPITHPLTCSLWGNEGKPRIPGRTPLRTAPAEPQPEPRTFATEEEAEAWEQEQEALSKVQAQTSEDIEPLTPEEAEALLGPCTCGQAPTCLPSCARAGG